LRPAIIKETKKVKDGRYLVEELKKIEKKLNLSNSISLQLELELSALEVSLDICEVIEASHKSEQASEIPKSERSQIQEKEDSKLECTEICLLSYKKMLMQVYLILLMICFLVNLLMLPCIA
jgi:hypothetical protein